MTNEPIAPSQPALTDGQRERIKLAATYFNNTGVALNGGALFAIPLAIFNTGSLAAFWALMALAVILVAASILFRKIAGWIALDLDKPPKT